MSLRISKKMKAKSALSKKWTSLDAVVWITYLTENEEHEQFFNSNFWKHGNWWQTHYKIFSPKECLSMVLLSDHASKNETTISLGM